MNHEVEMKQPEDFKSTSLKPLIQAVEAEIETHDRPEAASDDQGLLDMNHEEKKDMPKLTVEAVEAEIDEERPIEASTGDSHLT